MIPTSFLSRLSLPSPQQTERDLARLIHRTIELDRRANRQLGYAAVNIGCDGVRRVTMFDGSSCQTSGDVCLATREEGITVCLDTPSGAGLAFQRIAFAAPACEPVTGWWIVDAEGYMYKIPAGLITAAPYWPMSADPAVPAPAVTLVRSGTWAALMCGAGVEIPLNSGGGSEWYIQGECDWAQKHVAAIGGADDRWVTLPTIELTSTPPDAAVVFPAGYWVTAEGEGRILNGILRSYDTSSMVADTEYKVTFSLNTDGLSFYEQFGDVAATGTSIAPTVPSGHVPIAVVTVAAGGVISGSVTASYADVIRRGLVASAGAAILLRDKYAPNRGSRVAEVTLPSADSSVVAGPVRVAYGYPFGGAADRTCFASHGDSAPAPWARPSSMPLTGRHEGDMALCYRRSLGVQYGDAHVCLDGSEITTYNDYVPLVELDYTQGRALDTEVSVVGMPGGEVAVFGAGGALTSGKRYRVRPAPAAAPTVEVVRTVPETWGDDADPWVREATAYVNEWISPTTEFEASDDLSDLAIWPGRGVPCVLWFQPSGEEFTFLTAAWTVFGSLGPTVAGKTTIHDEYGAAISLPAYPAEFGMMNLTIIGPQLFVGYGWTFTIDGVESALSPIVGPNATAGGDMVPFDAPTTFGLKITVPAGPPATEQRSVYGIRVDAGSTLKGYPNAVGEWSYLGNPGGTTGAVYDRSVKLIAAVESNPNIPTDPVVVYDTSTALSRFGTRPPSPLVYLGPIVVDAPRPVHLLQPMEL
jgi:hypothetical protein